MTIFTRWNSLGWHFGGDCQVIVSCEVPDGSSALANTGGGGGGGASDFDVVDGAGGDGAQELSTSFTQKHH
jgi:hypothetical protein